jgi:DNA-binding response OmpR family regulator
MLRLALYSKDSRLQSVLALALGGDYRVLVESSKETIKRIVDEERLDVLILDLDSNYGSIEDQLGLFDEMRDSRIPVVVMTDDQRRSTAMELVQWGVYDYFRKPPSLPELKIVVRRAHEHSVLKRELEETRETLRAAIRRQHTSRAAWRFFGLEPSLKVIRWHYRCATGVKRMSKPPSRSSWNCSPSPTWLSMRSTSRGMPRRFRSCSNSAECKRAC